MSTTFEATYEATPESISLVRHQMAVLAQDCGLDEMAISDVKLAVSEAATNALVHGYRNGAGKIRVEAGRAGGELVIIVGDDGGGMKPRRDSPGLGLGLPVIARLANRLEISESNGPGTELRMAFDCPRAAAPVQPVFG
jgi:serine/threonine-protein kinase RsbW/stage II sporulation protein AB (anti-sigma F factor)